MTPSEPAPSHESSRDEQAPAGSDAAPIALPTASPSSVWGAALAALGVLVLVAGGIIWASRTDVVGGDAIPSADKSGGVVFASANLTQDAEHIVEVYLDFMCVYCQEFERDHMPTLWQLAKNGEITLQYRPMGLLDRYSQGTKFSSRSASALYCVAEHNPQIVDSFLKEMYANAPEQNNAGPTSDEIASLSAQLSLGEAGQQCIKNDTYVSYATEQATRVTKGTPDVLIDGESVNWRLITPSWVRGMIGTQAPENPPTS